MSAEAAEVRIVPDDSREMDIRPGGALAEGLKVGVLGDVVVAGADEAFVRVDEETLALLVAELVLRRGDLTPYSCLRDTPHFADQGNAHTRMTRLRKLLGPGVLVTTRTKQGYVLEVADDETDLHRFVAVSRRWLAGDAGADELDSALRLWRGAPHWLRAFPSARHHQVLGERDQLVQRLASSDAAMRASLPSLVDFLAIFSDDPGCARLHRNELEARAPVARRRLLIVDDKIADPLAKRLGAYDCTLVRSIDDWYELVKDGHPDFDGAVVDLHLTPTFDDYFGFEILKQLRQREIPAIIMTANPGDGEYAPAHRNLIMHDPHNIILKRLEAPADEPKLREAVHAMMDGRPGVDWHSLGSRES